MIEASVKVDKEGKPDNRTTEEKIEDLQVQTKVLWVACALNAVAIIALSVLATRKRDVVVVTPQS